MSLNIPVFRASRALRRVLPCAIALAATMVAAPGHAIDIPEVPLQSGSAYPPANIRFILDDSGSMSFDYMPDDIDDTSPVDISLNTYVHNTLYYNPSVTYEAWRMPDGSRYSGGTSYNSVYASFNLAGGTTIDLGDSGSCARYNTNDNSTTDEPWNGTQVCGGSRSFYVPKTGATDLTKTASFWRYTILAGGADIIRSEYGPVVTNSQTVLVDGVASASGNLNNGNWITLTTGAVQAGLTLEIVIDNTSSGNGSRDLRYEVRNPSGNRICDNTIGKGNSRTCTDNPSAAGTYTISLRRDDNRTTSYRVTAATTSDNRCPGASGSTTWINCTSARPELRKADGTSWQRSLAAELTNYATWYSYHRTRIKAAKAGASEAFYNLGSNVRVGYDTIWNRNAFNIPVGEPDKGIFTGSNRTTWFTRLQGAIGYNGTPLKGALQRAGKYFSDTSASGPWGPETGSNQLSCRQNFAILTTDGYWNDNSGYTDPVGDADGTAGPTITSPKGGSWTYEPTNPYKDNFSTNPSTQPDTLADVAMHYWKNDLVTSLANNVPVSSADPAFWQHMVTFGVSIGLKGRAGLDLDSITKGTERWGDPTNAEDADRIDDLWHAAVNGRGSFVTASNPIQFVDGLLSALKTVEARLGSASNVTANSTSFVSDTRVYQASYTSGKWTGELASFSASESGVAATPSWTASSQISAVNRNVYTWNGVAGGTFPTTSQLTDLDRSSRPLSPVNGTDNAAYIKGDSSKEKRFSGGVLRNRDSLLGDIVNSSPIFVKDTNTIYVGANDGMLHAFNAANGAELFAYVPGGINFSDLASFSDPQYTHKYFVDGPIVVSTQAQTPNKNYLVGALGRGGKGLFGLDVTTPGSFAAGNVKWEYTSGTNMGYVLGEPLIATLNDASNTKVVIVGNGINSSNGRAVLFVINIATGALITEIDTGVGGDNGMSAPRGWDDNGDGTVDYVYAGDLKGNLWKFDFSTSTLPTSATKLFQAASGQPITAGLALARDPVTSKRWVFIGTGKFMENGDVNDATVQSMYGIIDDGSVNLSRSDLAARDILVSTTLNGKSVRGFAASTPLESDKKGWYIDLDDPTAGERIVSRPQVKGTVLITASIIPPTNDSCEAGGSGYINALDAFTGTSLKSPYFDMNGDGKFDDNDKVSSGDTNVPIGSIDLGVGMPTLPTVIDKLLVVGGSTGTLASLKVNPQGGSARRVSWREILED